MKRTVGNSLNGGCFDRLFVGMWCAASVTEKCVCLAVILTISMCIHESRAYCMVKMKRERGERQSRDLAYRQFLK